MNPKTLDALTMLDLKPGATIQDVKKSYRELALIWHPDKVPDQVKERATNKFTKINEAYTWLNQNPSTLLQSPSEPSRKEDSDYKKYRRYSSSSKPPSSDKKDSRSTDPVVRRILNAARKWKTDPDEGIYIYPDIDIEKSANFIAQLHGHREFTGLNIKPANIVIFYDIDGTGEEGMALTTTNQLVNNNSMTLFSMDDLIDVKLQDALFFWREISVRLQGKRSYELAGYAGKQSGKMMTDIIHELIKTKPSSR